MVEVETCILVERRDDDGQWELAWWARNKQPLAFYAMHEAVKQSILVDADDPTNLGTETRDQLKMYGFAGDTLPSSLPLAELMRIVDRLNPQLHIRPDMPAEWRTARHQQSLRLVRDMLPEEVPSEPERYRAFFWSTAYGE